ncbi:hypothetical protein BKA82DRAFT_31044 [Pisolithus tinctorius]|uniref:Uncharacterized protein n=1 Tax=Pisolithus tinctorius Marx 270 TaxID=870435 RepID=A0A0C3IP23_PISTI|nr:hypothetical protein BKA82DRAFT_31044 [Pisolithus tinctorius]KIN98722.1 hypothetical protein M404DRAFT_31044 [Pisolithus tinctorius Marx 270]
MTTSLPSYPIIQNSSQRIRPSSRIVPFLNTGQPPLQIQMTPPTLTLLHPTYSQHFISHHLPPPSIATFSDDSDSKLSSRPSHKHAWDTPADKLSSNLMSASLTFIKQFQQVQQDRLEVKHHWLEYGYWRTRQKTTTLSADCEHQLTMQHKLFAHEETVAAQELEKMKLTVKLEELHVQNLTLQKGIAGGEDQGPSSGTQDVYPL